MRMIPPFQRVPMPPRRPWQKARTPWKYAGTLAECQRRVLGRFPNPQEAQEFTRRWYRAQMRAWAMNWRDAWFTAAQIDEHPERTAKRALTFATLYRDEGRKL